MFSHQLPVEDFVITKSTGDYGNLQPQYFLNEKGLHRAMLGQYNVPFLTDEIKISEDINTPQKENDWYLDKLPAHIQLLEKIKRRGQMRNEGSRLEYVIVETNDLKDKQSAKIETLNYFKKNKGILNLDYLYYLSRLINPLDQLLEVIFNLTDFTKTQHKIFTTKRKLIMEINNIFVPKFEIEKDKLYLVRKNEKYLLIYGDKQENDVDIILKLSYVPMYVHMYPNFYNYLNLKYGATSTLKTQFIFKDNYILLGNMTESKLISTIKKELKK